MFSDMFVILSFQNATEPQTIPTPTPVMSLVIGVSVGLVILALVIVVLVIVVIIVIIVLILVVMKKRNKDYVLQQWRESHGFTNPLYTGRWIMQQPAVVHSSPGLLMWPHSPGCLFPMFTC